MLYSCKIINCNQSGIITTDKQSLFIHYRKHLRRDIDESVVTLGLVRRPWNESKYSLIDCLILNSVVKVVP
jgi:hypothetical protein